MKRIATTLAVLAVLAVPAGASASTRSCGTINVARFPHPSKVLVAYGHVPCLEAIKVLSDLENGRGKDRYPEEPESDGPIEVDHWHCGQGAGGAWCGKGEAANRGWKKYIQLIYGEAHTATAGHHKAKAKKAHKATAEPTEYESCIYNAAEQEEECEAVTLEQIEATEANGESFPSTPEEEAWFEENGMH
jgi:hypothetical protein